MVLIVTGGGAVAAVAAAGANAARDEAPIAGCVGGDAVIGVELVVVGGDTVEDGASVGVIVLAGADVTTGDGATVATNVGSVVEAASELWDVATADDEGLAAPGVPVGGASLLWVAARAGVAVVTVIRRPSASDRRAR